ncbi:MAG: vWA domain-containing protein [Acidobacteriota bacterium]
MFLVNLTWLQLFALVGGMSAGVVALYLWDRSKRRIAVPTLLFWRPAERAAEVKHRKRIQQPWSLILQLVSMALLLLALAQPRLGTRGPAARDHVLILDTSAWMAARLGKGTLMDEARKAARAYARSLPAGDRLMLVRADALPTPATAFERNRAAVEEAIAASHAGATSLDLARAVEFAGQAQKVQGGLRGEIVYAGAGRTSAPPATSNLRVLPVGGTVENCGLHRIGVRRSAGDPDVWEILVSVRNYGSAPRNVALGLVFGGSPAGSRRFTLPAASERNISFAYRTRVAGVLEAKLISDDEFPEDDEAAVELPAQKLLEVAAYTDDPETLRPVLTASPLVKATFHRTSEYRPDTAAAGVILFDRFSPSARPAADAIWIAPPADASPVRVRSNVANAELTSWRSDHPLAAGLRAKDLHLEAAEVFAPAADDVAVAEVESGPVIVARAGKPKLVVLGFQPVMGALRYQLTTPLLFANILRWMAPDVFLRWEANAGSPGTINVDLGGESPAGGVRVLASNGTELPYTLEGGNLRFFVGAPGTVRVIAGDREMVYSFTLPELADAKWTPPAGTRRGIPAPASEQAAFAELWPWLAALGALGLVFEWILFGRSRAAGARLRPKGAAA